MNNFKKTAKRITSARLFLPIACLFLVLLINVIKTPSFFHVSINNGVLYGYIIDVINRGSELVIFAVGMTLVVAASGGTDISVGAVSALAGAACCYVLSGGEQSATFYYAPYIVGLLAAFLGGLFCGCFYGSLVAKITLHSMVSS